MLKPPEGESCRECRFWLEDTESCHRNPPQFAPVRIDNQTKDTVSIPLFPPTFGHDWCGEWKKHWRPAS